MHPSNLHQIIWCNQMKSYIIKQKKCWESGIMRFKAYRIKLEENYQTVLLESLNDLL